MVRGQCQYILCHIKGHKAVCAAAVAADIVVTAQTKHLARGKSQVRRLILSSTASSAADHVFFWPPFCGTR
jgi:hypothetical protein